MPQELIVESPGKIAFREYADPPLTEDQVLLRTTVSGIKSGTELNLYRGQVSPRRWRASVGVLLLAMECVAGVGRMTGYADDPSHRAVSVPLLFQ